MNLWMAVDADEYELPIAVAESAAKLAKMLKVSQHAIYQKVFAEKQGEILKGYKIRKVEEEDD